MALILELERRSEKARTTLVAAPARVFLLFVGQIGGGEDNNPGWLTANSGSRPPEVAESATEAPAGTKGGVMDDNAGTNGGVIDDGELPKPGGLDSEDSEYFFFCLNWPFSAANNETGRR